MGLNVFAELPTERSRDFQRAKNWQTQRQYDNELRTPDKLKTVTDVIPRPLFYQL